MRNTIPSSPQSLFQSESKNSKLMKTDILDKDFLNSLIIHEERQKRQKKITIVRELWICDPNYHNIL